MRNEMDEEMDYSIYDGNGDMYKLRIKKREALKYDQDHLVTYRALMKLKKAGVKPFHYDSGDTSSFFMPPHNSTMTGVVRQHTPFVSADDDLRSPYHKKGREEEVDLNQSLDQLEISLVPDGDEELALPLPDTEETLVETVVPLPKTEEHRQAADSNTSPIVSWNDAAVHSFLNEMGALIKEFRKKRTPRSVYDTISINLEKAGYQFSAQALYDKKRGLDATFFNLKKTNGYFGHANRWPFYESVSHLRAGDWPVGFKSGPSITCEPSICGYFYEATTFVEEAAIVEAAVEAVPDVEAVQHEHAEEEVEEPVINCDINCNIEQAFVWTDAADTALIEEVNEARQALFDKGPLVKNATIFATAAAHMEKRGFNVNRDRCKVRYSSLQKRFREEYDSLQRTGAGACTWKFYQKMYDLEKGSVTVAPLVTVSVGTGKATQLKKASQIIGKLKRGQATTERTSKVDKLMGNKTTSIGIRSRSLDLQQSKLDLEREYLEEFRLYRLEAKERAATFKSGMELLKELKKGKENAREVP